MNFHILTLFPEMVMNGLNTSIIGRAVNAGNLSIEAVNIRDYAFNKHQSVDDYPYGGGARMLMQAEPVYLAHEAVAEKIRSRRSDAGYADAGGRLRTVYLSPQGNVFNQKMAEDLAQEEDLILLCGHYEGFDERIRAYVDEEISIGDYVLTGGEPAAMVVCDAIIRLQEGVILEQSHADDSFSDGLLEYPQYTKPAQFEGMTVPEVLLSGHHANIRRWRLKQSLLRTLQRRPDLLEEREFTEEELKLLEELCLERSKNICDE